MRARFDGLSMIRDRSGVLVGFYIPWMIFNRLWRLAAGRTIKGQNPRKKGESARAAGSPRSMLAAPSKFTAHRAARQHTAGVPPKAEREHAPCTEARTSLWKPLLCYPRYVRLTGLYASIYAWCFQTTVFFRVNSCRDLPPQYMQDNSRFTASIFGGCSKMRLGGSRVPYMQG